MYWHKNRSSLRYPDTILSGDKVTPKLRTRSVDRLVAKPVKRAVKPARKFVGVKSDSSSESAGYYTPVAVLPKKKMVDVVDRSLTLKKFNGTTDVV